MDVLLTLRQCMVVVVVVVLQGVRPTYSTTTAYCFTLHLSATTRYTYSTTYSTTSSTTTVLVHLLYRLLYYDHTLTPLPTPLLLLGGRAPDA